MSDPNDPNQADARPNPPHDGTDGTDAAETDVERAEEVYGQVGAENADPTTRREAIEGVLEDEGLSEAGGAVGEHNE